MTISPAHSALAVGNGRSDLNRAEALGQNTTSLHPFVSGLSTSSFGRLGHIHHAQQEAVHCTSSRWKSLTRTGRQVLLGEESAFRLQYFQLIPDTFTTTLYQWTRIAVLRR